MIPVRQALCGLTLAGVLQGCGSSVPLAPVPLATPVSMQIAPGPGVSLPSAGAVYLVVDALDAQNRVILPRLSEIIAGELRAATPADVIILVDDGLDCPPATEWRNLCDACHLPVNNAPPSSVVVFCTVVEYDPYTPLRLGLSMRVRRAEDGMQLAALQGTWIGATPATPPRAGFHWFRKPVGPRPHVDYVWNAEYEQFGANHLVREASHQCVMSLTPNWQSQPGAVSMVAPATPQFEELIPPAPPALPEGTPPAPTAEITESAESVPEESRP